MYKIWTWIVEIISTEWILTWFKVSNGGGIIIFRALLSAVYLFLFALLIINVSDPERTYEFSSAELQLQISENFAWYGVLFASIYTALYARFASQWNYMANLYNQIKQAECSMHNLEVMAEWKAGFMEDAENLHLATKDSVATIVKVWGDNELVKKKYVANTPGGEGRYNSLMDSVSKVSSEIGTRYKDV